MKVNVVQEKEDESSLLVLQTDEHANKLLQGVSSGFLHNDMWYLDVNASSCMNGRRSFYESLDETHKRVVRFGDGSSIRYEGKGEVLVDCKKKSECKIFENVLYILKLKTNILSSGKLDDQC